MSRPWLFAPKCPPVLSQWKGLGILQLVRAKILTEYNEQRPPRDPVTVLSGHRIARRIGNGAYESFGKLPAESADKRQCGYRYNQAVQKRPCGYHGLITRRSLYTRSLQPAILLPSYSRSRATRTPEHHVPMSAS